RLTGGAGNRDMQGARVAIRLSPQRTLWRRARADGSYLSANDPRVLAGLATARRVESVTVHWPSGKREEWENPPINRYLTLRENTAPAIR
ncbi:MAG: ASPIC/UnbV domain-containing protein, partial [Blastocatellia bacterium]